MRVCAAAWATRPPEAAALAGLTVRLVSARARSAVPPRAACRGENILSLPFSFLEGRRRRGVTTREPESGDSGSLGGRTTRIGEKGLSVAVSGTCGGVQADDTGAASAPPRSAVLDNFHPQASTQTDGLRRGPRSAPQDAPPGSRRAAPSPPGAGTTTSPSWATDTFAVEVLPVLVDSDFHHSAPEDQGMMPPGTDRRTGPAPGRAVEPHRPRPGLPAHRTLGQPGHRQTPQPDRRSGLSGQRDGAALTPRARPQPAGPGRQRGCGQVTCAGTRSGSRRSPRRS